MDSVLSYCSFCATESFWFHPDRQELITFYFKRLKNFFWCGSFFKVFIEFVTILLLFYVLLFWLWGMWDLSFPTRDRTHTPFTGRGGSFFRLYIQMYWFIFKIYFWLEIIALQCCVGFCQSSTWISHRHAYVLSLVNLPPTSHTIPPLWVVMETWLLSLRYTATCH